MEPREPSSPAWLTQQQAAHTQQLLVGRLVAAAVLGLLAVTAIAARVAQSATAWQPGLLAAAIQEAVNKSQAELLSSHEFFLSAADVRRGQAYHGSGDRLNAFAAKLLEGQPVHVVVAGGSVAWGQGATLGGSFGRRFFNWLNATWPSPLHRYTNAAKPAIKSALFALCGSDMIPQDADLVVLEFAFNDFYPGLQLVSPERAAFEQLVRRLLGQPNSPAIIALNFFSYWHAKPDLNAPGPALFYRTGEDDLALIAQYYDMPVLSVRNAAYPHMLLNEPGFQVEVPVPAKQGLNLTALDSYFYYDSHHPWDRTGHRAMADLLVAAVQEGALAVLQGTDPAATTNHPIPPPMFPGNWEPVNTTCRLGAAFKTVVKRSKGFKYKAQNPNGTHYHSQKWGWAATAPGAYVVLHIDTRAQQQGAEPSAPVRVYLGHTCRELGTASVSCIAGCNCTAATMDHHWKHKNTQTALWSMQVSQHEACEVLVTVDAPAIPATQPLTVLTALIVDAAGAAGARLEMGNVGQWDMMGSV